MILLLNLSAIADSPALTKMQPSHYINLHLGQSMMVLGTSEQRTGVAFGYGFGREDRKLRWKDVPAQLVHYVHYFHGSGEWSPGGDDSIGYTALARYRFRTNGSIGAFVDLGWGLLFSNHTSEDVNSRVNSTPYLGFGIAKRTSEGEFLFGLGWFHISNAGTAPPNNGQNYLHVTLGVRY